MSANLHNKLHNINKLNKYTNFKTRLSFINGYIIGKLQYMLPLYMNANQNNINKLHKVLMRAARTALGHYGLKLSITQILDKCNWLTINKMIKWSTLKFLHKIINNNSPKVLISTLRKIRGRSNTAIAPFYIPKMEYFKNFFMQKGLKLYNQIPNEIKSKNETNFKKASKQWIKNQNGSDEFD